MNLSDKLADLAIERQLDLNRYTGSLQNNILRLMRDLALDIEEQFRGDLTDYNKARLSALIREIRTLVADTYGVLADQLSTEFPQLAADEAAWARQSFNAAVGANLMASLPTEAAIAGVAREIVIENTPMRDWLKRGQGDTEFRLTQAIRAGISLGETNGQIMRRIRGDKEKLTQQSAKGTVIGITRANLNTLVRTSVQEISSNAMLATYSANADIIKSIVSLATLDSRTTELCASYDLKEFDAVTKEPIGHSLPYRPIPRHFGCRSRWSPRVKSFKELGLDIADYSPSVRASMDGEVPAKRTFEEFLAAKPKAWQDEYLGKGRADLWREKKLTLADLLDQSGNPLTLRELQARYGQ
ncbi:MAG TPA: hypothetical protein VFV43_09185 [Limnobacter sp.]|nr:hypothetical protein [Limnobacter sp.]